MSNVAAASANASSVRAVYLSLCRRPVANQSETRDAFDLSPPLTRQPVLNFCCITAHHHQRPIGASSTPRLGSGRLLRLLGLGAEPFAMSMFPTSSSLVLELPDWRYDLKQLDKVFKAALERKTEKQAGELIVLCLVRFH